MKQLSILILLLSFCVNQLHLLDYVSKIKNECKLEAFADETDTSGEKEEAEKELEEFTSAIHFHPVYNNPLALLKNNIFFVNLTHSSPFTQKDLKPPCAA